MDSKRGFHFLVGIAALWLIWRLYSGGYFHDAGFLLAGMEVQTGPGAIIVGVIIEFVITVGWVATLVASGLWGAAVEIGVLINDVFEQTKAYLLELQPEDEPADDAGGGGGSPPSDPPPPVPTAKPMSDGQKLLATIVDTRKRQDQQAKVLSKVSESIVRAHGQTQKNAEAIDKVLTKLDAMQHPPVKPIAETD